MEGRNRHSNRFSSGFPHVVLLGRFLTHKDARTCCARNVDIVARVHFGTGSARCGLRLSTGTRDEVVSDT